MLIPWEKRLQTERDSVYKTEVARDVICKLNEGGDQYIRQRREIIRRIVDTEDFSSCWPGERLEAQGLVARVREVVNIKDSFTRMQLEREMEVKKQREQQAKEAQLKEKQKGQLQKVRDDLARLIVINSEPQKRGLEFQQILSRLFQLSEIQFSEPLFLEHEQIDGAVYFDSHLYLVEAKWWNHKLEHSDVSDFYIKVASRPKGTRGLFISASGYTDGCIQVCTNPQLPFVVYLTTEDIILSLENQTPLAVLLRRKVQYAGTVNRIFVPYNELLLQPNQVKGSSH